MGSLKHSDAVVAEVICLVKIGTPCQPNDAAFGTREDARRCRPRRTQGSLVTGTLCGRHGRHRHPAARMPAVTTAAKAASTAGTELLPHRVRHLECLNLTSNGQGDPWHRQHPSYPSVTQSGGGGESTGAMRQARKGHEARYDRRHLGASTQHFRLKQASGPGRGLDW